jgi:hypothetical protein
LKEKWRNNARLEKFPMIGTTHPFGSMELRIRKNGKEFV